MGTGSAEEDHHTPTPARSIRRVLHVLAPFDHRDAVGRFVEELARHQPKIESDLCTSRVLSGGTSFRSIHALGGPDALFHMSRWRAIAATIERTRPNIVHLHGGIWLPFLAMSPAFRRPVVMSVYRWPRLPAFSRVVHGGWAEMRVSGVPRGLLMLSTILPPSAVRAALRRPRVRRVLTQDPTLARRLNGRGSDLVRLTEGGSDVDDLRATFRPDAPEIIFAGRAQTARGIDTLIAAMPRVLRAIPRARLRLLLRPTRGPSRLARLERSIDALGIRANVDVELDAADDLRARFANATVGVFPFKYDDTTLTPPFTVVEAMSVGLPIIGTEVACLAPVMRGGEGGLVVPARDHEALAGAILAVLSDADTWTRLSRVGPSVVRERWSWDRAAAVTQRVYEEVWSG
jgi:glycosyltransferase involved in cell wall biosynthesis